VIYLGMGRQIMDNDGELLARVVGGDERALDELYRSHGRLALNVAFRVLRDATLSEDAVQEGFLDLWRTAERFDPRRTSVRAWLCVLVHRRAVDLVRREAARRARDEAQPPPRDESPTAEELIFLRYDRRRIQKVVEQLPDSQRQLVELAYWGGLTQSQLATRFGLRVGTVKSRMFSALNDLRVALAAAA
jgi:RNA polymerase sigma-70 factor, ECF subfamily